MADSRRGFLTNLAAISGAFMLRQSCPPMPHPRHVHLDPPEPAEKQDKDEPESNSKLIQLAQLRAQEKEFRETMELLYIKVRDLHEQLAGIATTQVFSVTVYKQAQEIEKLAKQLKNRAKG